MWSKKQTFQHITCERQNIVVPVTSIDTSAQKLIAYIIYDSEFYHIVKEVIRNKQSQKS